MVGTVCDGAVDRIVVLGVMSDVVGMGIGMGRVVVMGMGSVMVIGEKGIVVWGRDILVVREGGTAIVGSNYGK